MTSETAAGIAVFIGTKAQYIKTAPLLRLMDEAGVPYRLIDSGQHAELAVSMRSELGVRDPDYSFGSKADVTTVPGAVRWSLSVARHLWSRRRLRTDVFNGASGLCVIHGDTPSTLLSMLLAKRAGYRVAHLEAGLRSHNVWNPFPEELIRLVVMRYADICYAPTAADEANLRAMRRHGTIVPLASNTSVEAVRYSLGPEPEITDEGPAIVTMHRVENLRSKARVDGFVRAVLEVRRRHEAVTFVVHGPTRAVIEQNGIDERLERAGVTLVSLVPHDHFVQMLARAPLALIDGGSIQEECGYIGVPTILWREATERAHGLGRNVVLSKYDEEVVRRVLDDVASLRFPPSLDAANPSEEILESLLEESGAPA